MGRHTELSSHENPLTHRGEDFTLGVRAVYQMFGQSRWAGVGVVTGSSGRVGVSLYARMEQDE